MINGRARGMTRPSTGERGARSEEIFVPVFRHSDTEREGAAGKPRAEESWRSVRMRDTGSTEWRRSSGRGRGRVGVI